MVLDQRADGVEDRPSRILQVDGGLGSFHEHKISACNLNSKAPLDRDRYDKQDNWSPVVRVFGKREAL